MTSPPKKRSHVCDGWGLEGWANTIAWRRTGLPKDVMVTLAWTRWNRKLLQPSAGTSKGWKTKAISLVLSFRLANVPDLRKPRSGLFVWALNQYDKNIISQSPAFEFNLLRHFWRLLASCSSYCYTEHCVRFLSTKEPHSTGFRDQIYCFGKPGACMSLVRAEGSNSKSC